MTLDPYHITPNASINRVKLMSAPGLPVEWQGKTTFQVMGRETLVRRINEALPELASLDDSVRVFSEAYLANRHPSALSIANDMGLILGCTLWILKMGEAPNREARPQWDDSYWSYWGSIQKVILGGGLMSGVLGQYMIAKAAAMLDGLLTLTIARNPSALPLIGAARTPVDSHTPDWVFDFGGTQIKRAKVIHDADKIAALELMPALRISAFSNPTDLFHFMLQTITDTLATREPSDETIYISASLANYTHDGLLDPDTYYGQLGAFGENVCQTFSDALSRQTGHSIKIDFIHDGTAAASAYAGAQHAVVITVGTALGFAFPPPASTCIPLSETFSVQSR